MLSPSLRQPVPVVLAVPPKKFQGVTAIFVIVVIIIIIVCALVLSQKRRKSRFPEYIPRRSAKQHFFDNFPTTGPKELRRAMAALVVCIIIFLIIVFSSFLYNSYKKFFHKLK